MKNNYFFEKYTTLIGNVTFLVLAIMAIIFWRERTIMLDAAFQSFDVINKGHLAIQAQRFGAAFVQSFPLFASKMELPLKWVLISYSLSFVIFHYILFLICNNVLKVKPIALAIVLFTTLMTVHTFFWVQNEVVQGISMTFVYFAFLINREKHQNYRWFDYVFAILILVTVVYFHPLTVFSFVFCSMFFLISDKQLISAKKILASIAAWIVIVILKIYVIKLSTYDIGSMERLTKNIQKPIKELFNGIGIKLFSKHCLDDFAVILILMCVIVVFYLKNRNYSRLLVFSLFSIGYIFVVIVSFYDSKFWFYLESQFLPLSVLLILPLVFDIIPSFRRKRWALIFILSLVSYKLFYISYSSSIYTNRLQYLNSLLEYTYRYEGTKFMTDNDYIDQDKLLMHWGCAYETLYISLLKSPDSTRTIAIYDEPTREMWITAQKNSFHTAFDMIPYKEANLNYFNFIDTSHSYKLLNQSELPLLKK